LVYNLRIAVAMVIHILGVHTRSYVRCGHSYILVM
jgi:hypothetical protein